MSMRQIYRKIAKEHGITTAEVKRDKQAAIDHAYQHTHNDGITERIRIKFHAKAKSQPPMNLYDLRHRKSEMTKKSNTKKPIASICLLSAFIQLYNYVEK